MSTACSSEVRLFGSTPNYRVYTFDRFILLLWLAEADVEGMAVVQVAYDHLIKTCGMGLYLLTLTAKDIPMPTPEVSEAISAFLAFASQGLLASAVVPRDSDPDRRAWIRSTAREIGAKAKSSYPHRPFGSLRDAVEWFELDYGQDPARIWSVVNSVI